LEIVAIDDGSTDGSSEILAEYQNDYPERIRVFTKENGGQATARNLGIRMSKGDYIGFADSDDYVDKTMYAKLYHLAKEQNADLVECRFFFLRQTSRGIHQLKPRGNVRKYNNQKEMFINPQVSPWNKLYRRDVLLQQGVDFPEGYIYEDTSFFLKTIPYIQMSACLDEAMVFYHLRDSSTINSNKNRKVSDIFDVLEDALAFYKKTSFENQYQQELEYFCVKIAFCSSLSRIGRVEDKKIKQALLDQTWEFVNTHFPDYKKNKYLTGKIGTYIGLLNEKNAGLVSCILGQVMKG
jgi:glycosyltransferase involved in cell wall biosynthesis